MNRRRLLVLHLPGPARPLTLPEAKNCEPVHSPPLDYLLDYRTVNLQCLVLLAVNGSYRLQQLNWLLWRELWRRPCRIQAVAVCAGEPLGLYSFSTWTAKQYNIVCQLVKSSVFKPIITY